MTKYIILLSAVMAFACNYECEERKIAALERIATALEKLNNNSYHPNVVVNSYKAPEPKKTPTEATVVVDNWGKNLNHLNFEPRNDEPTEFVFDDFEVEDSCEDKCKKKNYSDYTRNMCIKNNCGDNVDF